MHQHSYCHTVEGTDAEDLAFILGRSLSPFSTRPLNRYVPSFVANRINYLILLCFSITQNRLAEESGATSFVERTSICLIKWGEVKRWKAE